MTAWPAGHLLRPLPIFSRRTFLLLLLLGPAKLAWALPVERYLTATLRSLDCLRDAGGMVQDKAELSYDGSACPLKNIYAPTSPTNIALDLLIQMERGRTAAVRALLRRLTSLEYHQASGLFFARYAVDRVTDRYVSTIDNAHLALAFWTIAQRAPHSTLGRLADALFRRMRFRSLYDSESGLFWGGLRPVAGGLWEAESWRFRHFGSESRTLYALAYAFRWVDDADFLEKFVRSSTAERFAWRGRSLLGLWDGGTFQLLLPRLLLHEERYSRFFADFYRSYADYIVAEGEGRGLPLPAAHSACEFADDYNGKVGSAGLVSRQNRDFLDRERREHWQSVVTPHALLMSWAVDPARLDAAVTSAENLGEFGRPLYDPSMGWADGFYVEGARRGFVVPKILALDQEMIALALLERSGASLSSSTLAADPVLHARLVEYYAAIDAWLEAVH